VLSETVQLVTEAKLVSVNVTDPQYPLPQSLVTAKTAETPFSVMGSLPDATNSGESLGAWLQAPRRATGIRPMRKAMRERFM
jgi:hypothetical protein